MIHNSNTNKKECMTNYVIFNTQQIKVNSIYKHLFFINRDTET